ncbi:MAG: porin [Alistipes sp.]|nr:porin [Alistipes sp.]
MKKFLHYTLLLWMIAGWGDLAAQEVESDLFKLGLEMRADWVLEELEGHKVDAASGFKGRYLNLQLDGRISPKFTYSWRQRLNRIPKSESFFNATDWVWINYQPTKNWGINAGKQVVWIGGWEYDRSPIDLYFCSEFWNNINCYQFGASVTYTTNDAKDYITLQACQSPFDTPETDLYAFNLLWGGTHGCYKAIHSINASQYADGKYIFYLALGNQFQWGDARLQIDYMERNTDTEDLFENFSLMGEFSYLIADRVNLFVKATYDKCDDGFLAGADQTIFPGTELTRVGGGVEYYPLGGRGDRSVRLHAAYAYTIGNNENPAGALIDSQSFLTIGATWRIDILKIAKKLLTRHE